jgi:pimeloyl-ACP methyl ester carboxylesterase
MSYRLIGNVAVASEATYLRIPRHPRPLTNYPVILLHGANTPTQYEGASWPSAVLLGAVLARSSKEKANQGIPTISAYLAADPWGNATSASRISALLTYLGAQTGCSTAKVHLIGTSMGTSNALPWAIANPSKVASINCVIPAVSIQSLYAQNPGGGFTTDIAAAWAVTTRSVTDVVFNSTTTITSATGFTSADVGRLVVTNTAVRQSYGTPKVPFGTTIVSQSGTSAVMSAAASVSSSGNAVTFATPLPTTGSPNANLLGQAGALAGIPTRFFYSTVDPYIDPADVAAMTAAIGGSASAVAIDSTYGHANGSMAEWANYNGGTNYSDLVNFLVANGA